MSLFADNILLSQAEILRTVIGDHPKLKIKVVAIEGDSVTLEAWIAKESGDDVFSNMRRTFRVGESFLINEGVEIVLTTG